VSIASLTVTNSHRRVLLNVVPNAYPASRILTRKEPGDESLVTYIQVSQSWHPDLRPDSLLAGPRIITDLAVAILHTVP
jgi:Arf-GAP/SH3 domain/ANK repeat/PH domain-containing protein